MKLRRGSVVAAVLASGLAGWASPARAAGEGSLLGWVADTQGEPVPGALISLFGKGTRSGSLVTVSDDGGRFFIPSVPAGSYTLRAIERSHIPAPARQVTVLPNQGAFFSVSLQPLLGRLTDEEAAEQTRELCWLLRHKRRSALEDQARGRAAASPAPEPASIPLIAGTIEVVGSPAFFGANTDPSGLDAFHTGFSIVELKGRLAGTGHWIVSGLLSEADSATWRMSGEFNVEPWSGHEIRGGSGYGTRIPRPLLAGDGHLDNGAVGAVFLEDRWRVGERVTASVGTRYSYIGFLSAHNHVDPSASIEVRREDGTRLRGAVTATTVAPGGDFLTTSSQSPITPLALALMDPGLLAEHVLRYEVSVERAAGPVHMGLHAFQEGVRDQLFNSFDAAVAPRSLRITNGHGLKTRGVGLTVSRRFGKALETSVAYTYGRAWQDDSSDDPRGLTVDPRRGDYHDVVARVTTFVDWTDTRLVAVYRLNTLNPRADSPGALFGSPRYDVQLRQTLPYLGALTRAEWELLFTVRNLFYEDGEGASLDELAVVNPPKRVLGGISVRF